MLSAKAWNGRVVCTWLADLMPVAALGFGADYDEGRLALACHASNLDSSMQYSKYIDYKLYLSYQHF